MRPSMKIGIGGALVSAALAGVTSHRVLIPVDLPEPHRAVQKDVFPELDFGAAVPGSPVERIYGSFGKPPLDPSTKLAVRRCVCFHYDPELYEGALVVLAHSSPSRAALARGRCSQANGMHGPPRGGS